MIKVIRNKWPFILLKSDLHVFNKVQTIKLFPLYIDLLIFIVMIIILYTNIRKVTDGWMDGSIDQRINKLKLPLLRSVGFTFEFAWTTESFFLKMYLFQTISDYQLLSRGMQQRSVSMHVCACV